MATERAEAAPAPDDDAAPEPEDVATMKPAERGSSPVIAATRAGVMPPAGVREDQAEVAPTEAQGPISVRGARREPHPHPRVFGIGDRIFDGLTAAFAGLILVILGAILVILVWQARFAIQKFGAGFLSGTTWDPIREIYGAYPAIVGTIYVSILALLLAAPVGVMVAIYLTELAPRSVRFVLGFVVELLAAVPSIVFGLWALFILVPIVRDTVQPPLIDHFGSSPLFSGYPLGLGVLTASLILAIMILPTVASISRDVMLSVPNSQRDAMLALGATRWETTWKAVIPYARSGIVGAIVLALGRAIGETMAVQMVIGNTYVISASVFNTGETLPAKIVTEFQEATSTLHQSALIELALILMVVTLVLNGVARLLVWRMNADAWVKL